MGRSNLNLRIGRGEWARVESLETRHAINLSARKTGFRGSLGDWEVSPRFWDQSTKSLKKVCPRLRDLAPAAI